MQVEHSAIMFGFPANGQEESRPRRAKGMKGLRGRLLLSDTESCGGAQMP
jgi:hypothetical protein